MPVESVASVVAVTNDKRKLTRHYRSIDSAQSSRQDHWSLPSPSRRLAQTALALTSWIMNIARRQVIRKIRGRREMTGGEMRLRIKRGRLEVIENIVATRQRRAEGGAWRESGARDVVTTSWQRRALRVTSWLRRRSPVRLPEMRRRSSSLIGAAWD